MTETEKQTLAELRAIYEKLVADLNHAQAVREEMEKLTAKRETMLADAAKLREDKGDTSPEYSQASAQAKALSPEIERFRMTYRKAIDAACSFSARTFQSHLQPLLDFHFAVFRAGIAERLMPLFGEQFKAERIASESLPCQAFQRAISAARRNMELKEVDESILRRDCALMAALLARKPALSKHFGIKPVPAL